MDQIDKRYIMAAVVVLIITFLAGVKYTELKIDRAREQEQTLMQLNSQAEPAAEKITADSPSEQIEVYVGGAVEQPMICKLPKGARVYQAIEQARAKSDADLTQVDMARVLDDGETIVVYRQGEVEANLIKTSGTNSGGNRASTSNSGKVNINRASAQEMAQRLTGIGEVLSQRIVEYREANGGFATEKDICNVSGIGEKKYESIKDMITVK